MPSLHCALAKPSRIANAKAREDGRQESPVNSHPDAVVSWFRTRLVSSLTLANGYPTLAPPQRPDKHGDSTGGGAWSRRRGAVLVFVGPWTAELIMSESQCGLGQAAATTWLASGGAKSGYGRRGDDSPRGANDSVFATLSREAPRWVIGTAWESERNGESGCATPHRM